MERSQSDVIVLCGAKVTSAFGFAYEPFKIHRDFEVRDAAMPTIPLGKAPTFVILPHPSGLNRAWQQPGAVARARAVLVESGVQPPKEAT